MKSVLTIELVVYQNMAYLHICRIRGNVSWALSMVEAHHAYVDCTKGWVKSWNCLLSDIAGLFLVDFSAHCALAFIWQL